MPSRVTRDGASRIVLKNADGTFPGNAAERSVRGCWKIDRLVWAVVAGYHISYCCTLSYDE